MSYPGFSGVILEPWSLMGLGFSVTVTQTAWSGNVSQMPRLVTKAPPGLMLPKRTRTRLKRIALKTKEALGRYAYKTSLGDFMPFKTYGIWWPIHERLKSEFESERDRFIAEYDKLPLEAKKEAEDWMARFFELVTSSEHGTKPTAQFSERIVSMMVKAIPGKRELFDKFQYKAELRPYKGLGSRVYSLDWPEVDSWKEIARAGVDSSIVSTDDIADEFRREIAQQYSQKCSTMLLPLLETISNVRISWVIMKLLRRALDDLDALNFFEDRVVSDLISTTRSVLDRDRQKELDTSISDLLAYVNSAYGKR